SFWSLWVNDVDQGDGRSTYIRSPPNNNPVKNVASSDIICNVANTKGSASVPVAPGDKVTFEWYHDNRADDIIDGSHKGPITVYIAPAASNGAGGVWTKLAESGLSGGVWAVDTLIANAGKHSLTLPSGLASGDYLLRAEIIALHEADTDYTVNSARGAQFYPSCSQVTVSGSGTVSPPGTFNFIGGYSPTDPGILFNLYGGSTTYTIPGPAVWNGASSGSGSASTSAAVAAAPTTTSVAAATTTTSVAVVVPTTTKVAVPTTTKVAVPTTTKAAVPTTTAAAVKTSTAAAAATSAPASGSGTIAKYFQCGGKLWTGATACVSGCSCVKQNDYYAQCL
ncbi:putative endo-beta-1,4-glucanase D, partial [Morchella snyderi]